MILPVRGATATASDTASDVGVMSGMYNIGT